MSEVLPRVFGAYQLLACIGKGAAGAAYLARPLNEAAGTPTPCVIKLLHARLAGKHEFVQRFSHEAEVAVMVQSRHVAAVFDVGQVADTLYIAMEYVPGWTLAKVIIGQEAGRARASLSVVHAMVRDAALGLSALHGARDESGVALAPVHRDLSPRNLMVGEEGRVRVIDLGLMKSRAQSWQTSAGRVMGSPGYMSPEQIQGQPVDRRTDLFALAVVTFELLTAVRYIPKDEPLKMLRTALHREFVPASRHRPEVPRGLDAVLKRAMAQSPQERWPDAADYAAALAGVLPAPAQPAEVQDFLRRLFAENYEARRAEVERLVLQPLPDVLDVDPATVFVRRPGVQPEPEGHTLVPTRVAGPALRAASPAVMARGAAPLSPDNGRTLSGASHSEAQFNAQPHRRGLSPWVIGMGLAAVGVAAAVAWLVSRPMPVVVPQRSGPVVAPGRPAPTAAPTPGVKAVAPGPGVSARPQDTPQAPPSPAVPAPGSSAPTPARATRSGSVEPRRTPVKATPTQAPGQQLDRLQTKAVKLKASMAADDPRRTKVDLLLARVAMLKAAGSVRDGASQIKALASQLRALED